MYDNMIDDYLYNPSLFYPTNVHLDKDVNITASARYAQFIGHHETLYSFTYICRFTLFNVLYAHEMKPIDFVNDELFKVCTNTYIHTINITKIRALQLSDGCIALIQQLDKSAFTVETRMIENALRDTKVCT